MLSEAQRAVLEPLVEACRPKAKTPPRDLRRTLPAIPWRHQNGAKWRAVPEELGRWWRAAQIVIRWARAGVWERLLALVQERGVQLGMVFLDGPEAIAAREGCSRRQVNALLSLTGLAPDIVEAAIAGRLPHGVALRDLTDPPLAWSEQRRRLGLPA